MIVASAEVPEANVEAADVCIVGAGAAGITLAVELDGLPLRVVLLEAGGYGPDPGFDDYYRGNATSPHPDLTQYRRTALGGTTSLWGGRCVPLDPIDFEPREHVPNSGWPISFDDLASYYPKAMEYCDAGKSDFTVAGSLPRAPETIAGFDGGGTVISDRLERYSLPTDFGKRYRSTLANSRNVTVILHARAVKILKRSSGDAVDGVYFKDRAAKIRLLRAQVVVLATGGIEVPRLLMNSDLEGSGLGNHHDLLGRYYTCHFENTCGRLVSNGAKVAFDFEKSSDGVYCRRKLVFSAAALRKNQLLNMAFRLHFPDYSNAGHGSAVMSAIYVMKSILPAEHQAILGHGNPQDEASRLAPHLRNILADLPGLAQFGMAWLFKIRMAHRKIPYTLVRNADGSYPIEFNSEQTPTASNRIALTHDGDRDGMKRVQATWTINDVDVSSAWRGFLLLRDTINTHSTCRLEFDERELRDRISRSPPLGGHHMGTARMSNSERSGIVAPDCSVFGLPNLYIASSAVFPTGGHANPTLTIVALAVRLAAALKARR